MEGLKNFFDIANWMQIILHPLGIAGFSLFLVFLILTKFPNKNMSGKAKSVFIGMACTSLVSGLYIAIVSADSSQLKRTLGNKNQVYANKNDSEQPVENPGVKPALETPARNNKSRNTPTPTPSSSSSLTPANTVEKKAADENKVNRNAKLGPASDPAKAAATAPPAKKPKKSGISIKVKVGNVTNSNGTIKIGVVETTKKKPKSEKKETGRTSR